MSTKLSRSVLDATYRYITCTALASLGGLALPAYATPDTSPVAESYTAVTVAADPVTLSFAFVGCNRVGWSHGATASSPSTANKPQLLQTFIDIKALESERGRAPEYLFLVGDLVRNESGARMLKHQLGLWQTLWDGGVLAGSKTTLVPLTGNHEVLKSVEYRRNDFYEVPDTGSNGAWIGWLNSNGHPPQLGNGPTLKSVPDDLLRGDNSQLTYSFDAQTDDGKSVHFILLDTDTDSTYSTTDTSCYQPPTQDIVYNGHAVTGTMSLAVPGWIPLNWVQKDLARSSGSDLTFAFGHKPLAYPSTAQPIHPSTGRDSIFNCDDKMLAQELYTSFSASNSFVAYLTAHRHLWNASQISDDLWQIIAGNGGSSLESGNSFGFTLIEVHQSGQVVATPYMRSVPSPYYGGATGVRPAQPGEPVTLRAAGW